MKQNRKILRFFIINMCFNIAANLVHPVTPTFIVERQLDASMFGVALAAMMFANFLFSPFWGELCNYIPTKRIMFLCGVGYGLGQLVFACATNETVLICGRMFSGVFVGGAYTAFSNYVLNTSPDPTQRGKNLTTLVTIQNVCGAIGYFIGGMLGMISVEAAFVAQVLMLVCSGLAYFLFCEDDTQYKIKPSHPLSLRNANPFAAFVAARRFMTPMLLMVFAIVAISSIGQNSYEQCFNYFIKDQFGMGSEYNGTIKAVIAVLTLALNASLGLWLQKKTDINRSFLWPIAATTVITGLILIFTQQWIFVAAYVIWSGINALRISLLQTMVAKRATEEHRNSVMGFYQSMHALGSIFGALFAGLIYASGPMRPFVLSFCAAALALLIGIVYVLRYRIERKF